MYGDITFTLKFTSQQEVAGGGPCYLALGYVAPAMRPLGMRPLGMGPLGMWPLGMGPLLWGPCFVAPAMWPLGMGL